jgi:peroxiredoxin Q/BCP
MTLHVGDRAPDFTLPSSGGKPVTLSELYAAKTVVVFFYPKDDTPGCTVEACSFRDSYEDFKEAGAEVVGISSQSVQSHQSFAEKNKLPFTLVADVGGKVRKLYGVPNTLGVIPGRVTYVIDQKGVVRQVFNSLLGFSKHAKAALDILKGLDHAPAAAPAATPAAKG